MADTFKDITSVWDSQYTVGIYNEASEKIGEAMGVTYEEAMARAKEKSVTILEQTK